MLFKRNVSLEMVQAGQAVVYSQAGAEYNGIEQQLRDAEQKAQKRKLGIWKRSSFISPAEHKKKFL